MNIDAKILKRLDDLIDLGQKVLSTRTSPPQGLMGDVGIDTQLSIRWLTSVSSLLIRVFGKSSPHYQSLRKYLDETPRWAVANQAFGVLLAAKDDYENDALFDVRELVEASLFDEFLEQAEYLLNAGYFQAAAVIAGSVLEDGLRKLCVKHEIVVPDKPKLDWMNSQLAKQNAYNKFTQKRITALADLRNSAALIKKISTWLLAEALKWLDLQPA